MIDLIYLKEAGRRRYSYNFLMMNLELVPGKFTKHD
jgi:hypothetical protein